MRTPNREWSRVQICVFMIAFSSRTNALLYEQYLTELVTWLVETKVKAQPPAT